jgi:hypothetical protein
LSSFSRAGLGRNPMQKLLRNWAIPPGFIPNFL